jgi:hypothetical protein
LNQDLLSGLKLPLIAQRLQRGDSRYRDGRRSLIREFGWFWREQTFGGAHILGKSPTSDPKDIVANLKLRDIAAHRFYPSRQVAAESLALGFA